MRNNEKQGIELMLRRSGTALRMIYHEKTGHPVFLSAGFLMRINFLVEWKLRNIHPINICVFTDFVLTLFIKCGKNKIYS